MSVRRGGGVPGNGSGFYDGGEEVASASGEQDDAHL